MLSIRWQHFCVMFALYYDCICLCLEAGVCLAVYISIIYLPVRWLSTNIF